MCQSGPYVEYLCEVYVREDFVIQCVIAGLALLLLIQAIIFAARHVTKENEP